MLRATVRAACGTAVAPLPDPDLDPGNPSDGPKGRRRGLLLLHHSPLHPASQAAEGWVEIDDSSLGVHEQPGGENSDPQIAMEGLREHGGSLAEASGPFLRL